MRARRSVHGRVQHRDQHGMPVDVRLPHTFRVTLSRSRSSPTYKMHRRSPVRIGFCVSLPVGSVLALGSMISTQAMPGATLVFLYLAVAWFVLYAACGALPYLAAGAEKRIVAAAFWGFGIGGAAAGELVAILVMSDNLASHATCLEHLPSQRQFLGSWDSS